jgi:uncharacterized protein YhaN
MRIESIDIRGFGCLIERHFELPSDKAVLVIERNETGKSTLAEAILAGLCGLPRERRSEGRITRLDTYRPWNGDSYAVELRIEVKGRRYLVERDFARNTFVVREFETNRNVTGQFEQDLLSQFLNLPREDYVRIAFICGKEVTKFDSSAHLKDRLSALVEGGTDNAGAERAIDILENARCKLNDGRELAISTAISRLKKDIEQKQLRIRELDDELNSASQDLGLLEAAQARLHELNSRRDALEAEYCAARLREIRGHLESASAHVARIAELREELASLQHYATFPAGRSKQLAEAIGSITQLETSLDEAKTNRISLEQQKAELSAEMETYKHFSMASSDDLTTLRADQEMLHEAKSKYEQAVESQKRIKHNPSVYFAKVLVALGLLGAIASFCLMVLRIIDPVPSALGTIVGILIAAGFGARYSAARNETTRNVELAKSRLEEVESRAKRHLANIGIEYSSNADLEDVLSRTETSLSQYLCKRSNLENVRHKLESVQTDISETQRRIESERDFINSILSSAGIDTTLPVREAQREFAIAEEHYQRMREIRDTLLPDIEARVMPKEEIERLKAEEIDLTNRLADLPAIETNRSTSDIERERRSVMSELNATKDEIMEIDRRIGGKVDKYRHEYPMLREEVCLLSAELDKLECFQKALELAVDTMHEVVESTRRRWAEALNKQAGEILPHLNPDYGNLLFDESLDFTLTHVACNRVISRKEAEAQLSTGAKDQIFLAARLACCRELSRLSEPIPVILDDPLIAADDHRFERAFRYLVETLSSEQQVIILSCHQSRHERFFHEEWFRKNVEIINLS